MNEIEPNARCKVTKFLTNGKEVVLRQDSRGAEALETFNYQRDQMRQKPRPDVRKVVMFASDGERALELNNQGELTYSRHSEIMKKYSERVKMLAENPHHCTCVCTCGDRTIHRH